MTGEAAPSPVVSAARACACERRAPLPPGGRWFEVRNGDVAVPVRARRRDDQCDEGPLPPAGGWFEDRNEDVPVPVRAHNDSMTREMWRGRAVAGGKRGARMRLRAPRAASTGRRWFEIETTISPVPVRAHQDLLTSEMWRAASLPVVSAARACA